MTINTAVNAGRSLAWPVGPSRPTLPRGEVHVWGARVDGVTDLDGTLSRGDQERASRFRFERDRIRWSGAHVLLNSVLARYLRCAPNDVVLHAAGPREKPWVHRPRRSSWLHFNLSHAGDMALVAVANRCPIGVDVEVIDDRVDHLAVARRALPEHTADALDALHPVARAEEFFRAWVRHEARGKYLGVGVVEPDQDRDVDVAIVDLDVGTGFTGALATGPAPTAVRLWSCAGVRLPT